MTRGIRSAIFQEPKPGDGRDRDLLPLPLLNPPGEPRKSVSHAVKKRLKKRSFVVEQVNKAVISLNSLYTGDALDSRVDSVDDIATLPLAKQNALRGIIHRINSFGPPPPGACRLGALQALRAACDGYSEPEPGVGVVVQMKLNQLSLPSGKVAGVDLGTVLEEPLGTMVREYEDWMLADALTWNALSEHARSIHTYNDPSLYQREKYLQFLEHLHQCGILSLTSSCRGRVGAFSVSKKPKVVEGEVRTRQRLILDCRAVSLMFREPPYTQLGSLAAVTELELGAQETLYTAGCDIQDCFYAAKMPEGLEQFFCLHQNISAEEAVRVFGEDLDLSQFSGTYIPCVNVLPMGFSWSFYIIQQLHEQATMRALKADSSRLIKDGHPAPAISGAGALAMPYCDNVHCMATSKGEADHGKQLIRQELERMGFTLHEDEESNEYFQTLGGIIDGGQGLVKPTPTRAWNCILAFEFLLHHAVTPKLVQQLVGHSIVISVLNRAGMSVFRHLYDFIENGITRHLNLGEKREVQIFIGLVPLLVGDLRRDWSSTIHCTDASPYGYGICERNMEQSAVKSLAQWQERWRFKHLSPDEWQPRKRSQGLDPLWDWDTARETPQPYHVEDYVRVDEGFPEVPHHIMNPKHWHTVLMGRWQNTSEHITLKEGRSLILALRRLGRNQSSRNKKHLILVDNMALAMSSCKGRATNYGMLRIMQQAAAISLAGNFSYRLRWVASELNVADGPSRGQISPGSYQGVPSSVSPEKGQEEPSESNQGETWKEEAQQGAYSPSASGSQEDSAEGQGETYAPIGEREGLVEENACESIASGSGSWDFGKEEQADYAGKALRWRKEQPPQSRVPLPKLVVYGMCMKMIAQGKKEHALKAILDFDTYMRPGESQDLMKKHLVIPAPGAGPQFRWYGVIVRDYDELRPDKVGIFDNTLLLNSVERTWLGDVLHKHVKMLSRANSKIFSFSSEEFRKIVGEVAQEMGVSSVHPYQLRHGGASDDLNAKAREYLAVKARGRWSTDQSVRRYGKARGDTGVKELESKLKELHRDDVAYEDNSSTMKWVKAWCCREQVDSDADGVPDTWQGLFGSDVLPADLCDGLYDGHVVVTDQGITEAFAAAQSSDMALKVLIRDITGSSVENFEIREVVAAWKYQAPVWWPDDPDNCWYVNDSMTATDPG
eukprot:Skav234597  [mRNA]  locus=scaffold5214:85992:100513:- [translate_table: standard]